ncbi:MAG: Uma2 family endonuclease [Blastocatellia bacterium]|nr:Uma2 family endonuclease [Blastocatellia bacterium]
MALPKPQPLYTVAEYLALERESEERHEYLDGVIYAMAGESGEHADVSVNITTILTNQLKGKDCRARSKDTKVRSGPIPKLKYSTKGLYSYPDVVVICGEPQYLDGYRDVVNNPAVIIEVLSPATEKFDRGEKFDRYDTWNPTLSDYLLVSQDQARIEHFIRQDDGTWTRILYRGLRSKVVIKSIRCTLKLKDVYDRIDLKPDLQIVK